MLLHHGGDHRGDQPRRARGGRQRYGGGHGVALLRHAGGDAPPFFRRLEGFGHFGLHEQREIAGHLSQRADEQAEKRRHFGEAIPLRMPGDRGQGEPQIGRERLRDFQALPAERGERPGSASELQHERARSDLLEPLRVPLDRVEPAGQLHPQGHRGGVLQPGPPGEQRRLVLLGASGQRRGEALQVLVQHGGELPELQDEARVHRVLAGRAPVHVPGGLRIGRGDQSGQRGDGGNRRVARLGRALGQPEEIEQLGAAASPDRLGGPRRDHSDASLGPRQRGLEVEHPLQARAVGEDRRRLRRAEQRRQELSHGLPPLARASPPCGARARAGRPARRPRAPGSSAGRPRPSAATPSLPWPARR